MSSSAFSSFYIKDGKIYACGKNDSGQLGLGNFNHYNYFVKVDLNFEVTQISYDSNFTFIIDSQGNLYACGNNKCGQLGLGSYKCSTNIFTQVVLNFPVVSVSCGHSHVMIIDNQGNLYACGDNELGQLGLGDQLERSTFIKVPLNFPVSKVSCGGYFTMILDNQNNLYSCGCNRNGQLGLTEKNVLDFRPRSVKYPNILNFTKVDLDFQVNNISCGSVHSMITDHKGNLYSCGFNEYKQLGLDSRFWGDRDIFTCANLNFVVDKIYCGNVLSIVTDINGNLYICGQHRCLKRPGGDYFNHINLKFPVTNMYTGYDHIMIKDNQNNLHVCGDNRYGELGRYCSGRSFNQAVDTEPIKIDKLPN